MYLLNISILQNHEEWQLLDDSDYSDEEADDDLVSKHDLSTAPLMTREAFIFTEREGGSTQYGVLGKVLSIQCVWLCPRVLCRD